MERPHEDPVLAAAYDDALSWLDGDDGERIFLVDFEDAGRGDRASELAELVEHI